MKYLISNIKFDTDGENIELPTEMEIDVPENYDSEEILQYLSDKISDDTGFCHFGFKTLPEIE